MVNCKKIICSSCGHNVMSNEKFCPNCGVFFECDIKITSSYSNNDNKPKPKTIVKSSYSSNKNVDTKKVEDPNGKICKTFSIASGGYQATFDMNNYTEMEMYKTYVNSNKAILFSCLVLAFLVMLFFILIASQLRVDGLVYFMIVVLSIISFFTILIVIRIKRNLIFEYIIYDLKKSGFKITYENRSTGTISFSNGKTKKQISVYRGYNSHANSRYW